MYVLWYVQKFADTIQAAVDENGNSCKVPGTLERDGSVEEFYWHIDGVLLEREKVTISYQANLPADKSEDVVTVPNGYEVPKGTTIKVGYTDTGKDTYARPALAGYEFQGWNTAADGSGTMYKPGFEFSLNANMTLYAIWSKAGTYKLVLNKVDGLGSALTGANFKITDATRTIVESTSGVSTYRYNNLQVDTVYTVQETLVPDNYKESSLTFNFILKSDGTKVTGYLCDSSGNKLTSVANVTSSYVDGNNSGTITITVTNIAEFKVCHSSTGLVQTFDIDPTTGDKGWNTDGKTFNITALLNNAYSKSGTKYIYGGYYTSFNANYGYTTDYAGTETAAGEDFTAYDGSQQNYWNILNACSDSGLSFVPEAGAIYYLKEVPETYLNPATYVAYDKQRDDHPLKQLCLVTAVDDSNYINVGFDVIGSDGIDNDARIGATGYTTWTVQYKNGTERVTYSVKDVFDKNQQLPGGYLAITEKHGYIIEGATYVERPYFVTPDGVKVWGTKWMKVYLGDATYTKWASGSSGIKRVGAPSTRAPEAT